jgi:hypothetical protein
MVASSASLVLRRLHTGTTVCTVCKSQQAPATSIALDQGENRHLHTGHTGAYGQSDNFLHIYVHVDEFAKHPYATVCPVCRSRESQSQRELRSVASASPKRSRPYVAVCGGGENR